MAREDVMRSEFEDIILHGREERNIEYKSSMNWAELATKLKVVKCCLAMSNIQDGGWMVFGLERKQGGTYEPVGMSDADAGSFDQDALQAYVNEFADPHIEPTVYHAAFQAKKFVVIRVPQFERVPVICKRDGEEKLKKGTVFTRSRRMFESAPVRQEKEMRDILDLALDRQMRDYLQRMGTWCEIRHRVPTEDQDAARFREERKDLE